MNSKAIQMTASAQTPVLRYTEEPDRFLRSRAFTLIELMISIALVLLLILGVNQVFTYTTQAVGAGEAVNAAIRSSRAAQATFAGDFAGIVPNGSGPNDSACIIISSRAYYAYRNAKDQAAQGTTATKNSTGLPTAAFLDLAGTGNFGDTTVNGDVVYPATYNFRNHRLDVISFFSRGLFPRQTGNPGVFVDNMNSQEAWVWYGHLQLPDNSGNFIHNIVQPSVSTNADTFPCMGTSSTNPNNYFGSSLVLGRMAMLLVPNSGGYIKDQSGVNQWYAQHTNAIDPLIYATKVNVAAGGSDPPNSNSTYTLGNSRIDLGDASIASFKAALQANYTNVVPLVPGWWDLMMDGNPFAGPAGLYPRFQCNPYVAKPMTSQGMAQASPYLMGGCSQFIVEFAGDFLTQDSDPSHTSRTSGGTSHTQWGDITAGTGDGQLDFTIVYVNGVPTKQIKWYGMPRSTSGNTNISGPYGPDGTTNDPNNDVVPVRDWLLQARSADGTTANALAAASFEQPQSGGVLSNPPVAGIENYGNGNLNTNNANSGYTCAFGPNDPAPKLIRITMTLEDPTGRLPEGQTYQYVFAVPQP